MLKSLDYVVSFPTTGRTFQNRIEFAPGLTAITGRNEAGKTLNLEMISYCLFGKSALRGLASDYKNLTATLALEIRGQDVLIERAKKETLTVDGEVRAIGAEAINKEIPAMLGFGLDVFNIACAAQQGDLDALTKMRPTERRQMVDRLVGLDLLEGIEKDCRSEAKTHRAVAESILLNLVQPQEPVQPEGYRPSEELAAELAVIEEHERERQRLSLIPQPVEPVEPTTPAFTDVEALEAHEAERQKALQVQAQLQGRLASLPEPTVSRGQLAKAVDYQEYQQECARRGPRPDYTAEQLEAFQRFYDLQRQAGDTVHCPKCEHEFVPTAPDLDLDAFHALAHPPITEGELTTQFRRLQLWDQPLDDVEAVVLPDLQKEILAHACATDRTAILDQLRDLVIPADRAGDLRAARDFASQRAVYDERRARFDADMATFRDARARLGAMDDRSAEVTAAHGRISQARTFESELVRYNTELEHWQSGQERSRAERELAEGFARGSQSLLATRTRVKQELAPELSRAASTLLSAMTAGERRAVDVDEDFNILVDGQPLQTLSGSGKSVVNLALRIGLGQVLTSKVLPIFLGDEIDKDMDQLRAGSTHETMQNLRAYLKQIILVTHKEIDADNVLSLDSVSA